MIEDSGKDQQPHPRRGARHQRMRPESIIPGQVVEPYVFDLEKSGLLEIRLRDTPGPRQILHREIVEQVHHHPAGVCVARAGVDRLDHEMVGPRVECLERRFADRIKRKGVPPCVAQSGQ